MPTASPTPPTPDPLHDSIGATPPAPASALESPHQPQHHQPHPNEDMEVSQTTQTNTTQSLDNKGTLNTESVTVESTPGGIRVKLPTLVLAHILSLAGVAGGTYTLNKPDTDQFKSDIAAIAARMERIERDRNAVVERLARIETLAENIREDLRDQRNYGGSGSGGRSSTSRRQPTRPAEPIDRENP